MEDWRLQDIFNLLPNLGVEELARSFAVQSNDMMLAIYLSSLTRSLLALHNLIDNKVRQDAKIGCIGRYPGTSAEGPGVQHSHDLWNLACYGIALEDWLVHSSLEFSLS